MNDRTDFMDGSQSAESTPRAASAHSTGAFPPASRQLMTSQASQTTSADNPDDQDSSFSESVEKLLSPRSKSIEDLRTSYRQTSDTYNTVTKLLYPQLLSSQNSDTIDVQREILLLELSLAQTKLALDYRISHYETTRNDQPWTSVLPKLAVTKGWLDECVQRIETPELRPDLESGNFFYELSHYFLATVIKQHQDSLFEGRPLPSEGDIFEVFQRAEPRARRSGLGPYLEELTGIETLDPELMPEVLLQLESKLASHTRSSTAKWPVPTDMVSVDSDRHAALRDEVSQLESLVEQDQIYPQGLIESDMSSELDAPLQSHESHHDEPLGTNPENNAASPQDYASMTDDVEMDMNNDIYRYETGASGTRVDLRGTDPEILTAEECVRRDALLKKDAEAAAQLCQVSAVQNNDVSEEQQLNLTGLSRRQRYEVMAGRELSCDTSQMGSSPWSSNQPDTQANKPDPAADCQSLTVFSDLPGFNELMEDVQDKHDFQMIDTPVSDTEFVTDDELPPDSNPHLAAIRARTSANASVSNTPTFSATIAPEVIPREVLRHSLSQRTRPRKSEPMVLIDTLPGSSQRTRISDSMFVSDDESDNIPPTSNPHLAPAFRRMAGATSGTPTSSASTTRTSTPKLPPHLAPVRKAAHRRSLNPSSQIPTEEERQILDQTEYAVVDIIKERTLNGKKQYLIKWQPIHGRVFMDTWEPAEYANTAAVRDWELIKMKKAQWKKLSGKPTRNDAGVSTSLEGQSTVQQPREPSPELGEEDTSIFFVTTAGDESLARKDARFVPALHTQSSSPSSSLADQGQVSFRTRSPMNTRDDIPTTTTHSIVKPVPEPVSRSSTRYAAQPFVIKAVSPKPIPKHAPAPASVFAQPSASVPQLDDQTTPGNTVAPDSVSGPAQRAVIDTTQEPAFALNTTMKDKQPTRVRQRANLGLKRRWRREEKAERRAEERERLANMPEKERAEAIAVAAAAAAEHARQILMNGEAKREKKRLKEERCAALPQEEKDRLIAWRDWKRGIRERTKEDKRREKANKERKRQAAAQKAAGAS